MNILRWIAPVWAFIQTATAGHSTLTATYQPLIGHSTIDIVIAEVTCLHWYSSSASSSLDLIDQRNVPPTDNLEQAKEDLNLASICGLKFSLNDQGAQNPPPPEVTLDATKFVLAEGLASGLAEDRDRIKGKIVCASLECVRRCLGERRAKAPVILKCGEADKEWLGKIVEEFNAHDRSKEFFTPSEGL
ncbi:hypothetical protein OKA05_13005 [Luteolibacter arcticus]|uniref:Uncharacterized protein n=1 Tax=Luteolibacter arcticus TaxID=1581411 RepID=A0ABT3GJ12_9BACT|nr:hypothetical protein [Luteolibacter arcticus]MCW1923476.1 hypothetical protein [Luteolibacter arcticus]